MKFLVTDRESIERGIIARSSYIVISIRDPDKPRAKVRKQSGLKDVLYLAFDDAEPVAGSTLPANIVLMTAEHASEILHFVQKWKDKVGTIVVHCEQGMSRSPAVAAAICQNDQDRKKLLRAYQPNQFIFQLMCNLDVKVET